MNEKKIEEKHKEKKQLSGIDEIRNIAQSIVDDFYSGHYTIEKYGISQYRFGFGIAESGDLHSMFAGGSVEEAMYYAIDFELTKEIKSIVGIDVIPRDDLVKLASERLATIQNNQQKYKELEDMIATKDAEYKKLMDSMNVFKHDKESIPRVVKRFMKQWENNTTMSSFREKIDGWEKKPQLLVAFLLEYIENLSGQLEVASHNVPALKKPEKEKEIHPPITGMNVLARLQSGLVFEPVWNEIRDTVIDGKWHIYSEVDGIVVKYADHPLTRIAITMKRHAYFDFAKDKKYHDLRGGKDYLFKWKRSGRENKFRFTIVKKPEFIERKKITDIGVKVDDIANHSIYKRIRDEFMKLFCDGNSHVYSEAIGLFSKYDMYKNYKQVSFYPLIRAYMSHVSKFYYYQVVKFSEDGVYKFRFDFKGGRLEGNLVNAMNNVKCARCGRIIHYGDQCMQVKNMFYHTDCYNILNKNK